MYNVLTYKLTRILMLIGHYWFMMKTKRTYSKVTGDSSLFLCWYSTFIFSYTCSFESVVFESI